MGLASRHVIIASLASSLTMTFKYRLKTYQNEEGEYSEYEPATRELILVMIAMHWTNETMPNNLEVISIANIDGQHLLLEHSNKHAFEVYFLPAEKGFHYRKKSDINVVLDSLDLFFKGKIHELKAWLNKTNRDDRYIRGDFFFIDHNYRYSPKRALRSAVWLLLPSILIPVFLFVPAFVDLPIDSIFIVGGVVFGIGLAPGIFLHLSYARDIRGWTIRITKGSDKIVVRSPSKTKEFSKIDILQVTQHVTRSDSHNDSLIPWQNYGYLEIEFHSGEFINLSNLICKQEGIVDKFSDAVKKYTEESYVPKLRHPTIID